MKDVLALPSRATNATAWSYSAFSPGVLPPPVERITATFPLLNSGRLVIFLVGGEKKKEIVHAVLADQAQKYPASRIAPDTGKVIWLLDAAANGPV